MLVLDENHNTLIIRVDGLHDIEVAVLHVDKGRQRAARCICASTVDLTR